ncbi:unnamed protein product [Bursaphelenchus okinawaensis]|uniref:Amino acid transporter transmembrane domain-containing protein n=1 Tax=Bursaphelenchus okinawaensis TaxID=465554 RepID=A0A811KFD5_9BILA|nr:unnamed protein product [Bursaphelenchus okinawaensis]CAG9102787.1 unnamed protein product [Bursaphelenchus okinawaensis]
MTNPLAATREVGNNVNQSRENLIRTQPNVYERRTTESSITPEQALIHLIKVMMGTGMLSLPLAFKHSGLFLGLPLLMVICAMDYANVMRNAVEFGPDWISGWGYFAKNLVNLNMFIAQIGFCCVYFVFMADNLKQFFDETSEIHISQAGWIALLLIPIFFLCTIRQLKVLAPFALIGNVVYIVAVTIVIYYLCSHLQPITAVKYVGSLDDMPLFFGTVMFAFEGIAVILPIENQMDEPPHFISNTGVLNTACLLVLAVYSTTGFYGYLAFGDAVKDTITLNLPNEWFYQLIKLMFVGCILVSFPLQFYVPIERIEKWISRKVPQDRQEFFVYFSRYSLVLVICLLAELIPHLALFISLIGAFAGTALALLFPPVIDLLTHWAQCTLNGKVWLTDLVLVSFGFLGFCTGTYASLLEIAKAFGKVDPL